MTLHMNTWPTRSRELAPKDTEELSAKRAEVRRLEDELRAAESQRNAKLYRLDRIDTEIHSVNRQRGEILRDNFCLISSM